MGRGGDFDFLEYVISASKSLSRRRFSLQMENRMSPVVFELTPALPPPTRYRKGEIYSIVLSIVQKRIKDNVYLRYERIDGWIRGCTDDDTRIGPLGFWPRSPAQLPSFHAPPPPTLWIRHN